MGEGPAQAQTELLITKLRRGEAGAFGDLVEIWERRLFYYVRRIVRQEEDAWDVVQETWMKAHTGLPRLREASAFPAWIYRIARHAAISHLRKEQRYELLEEEDSRQETMETIDPAPFTVDEAELVHWGLDQLPLPQRDALTLFFLEGFSVNEIADITRVSEGTVKSRLHYGKKSLRRIMEQEGRSHA